MFDYVIKDVMVVDGSGKEQYRADIGIKGGKIACKAVLGVTQRQDHLPQNDGCRDRGNLAGIVIRGQFHEVKSNNM